MTNRVTQEGDKYPDFRIADGDLYKNCLYTNEIGITEHKCKCVVLSEDRVDVIRRFHDATTAAHLSFYKTLQKIQTHYYWPKMRKDVSDYVRICHVCKASKAPNTTLMPQMGNAKPAKLPWELISVRWSIHAIQEGQHGSTSSGGLDNKIYYNTRNAKRRLSKDDTIP